ncbi:S41 family peptidase [Bacteroidota bacterium]
MKKKNIYIISSLLITVLLFIAATNPIYFKINKSFEIFGALFREIAANYVDDVDPEDMVKDGIEGMLNNLDPYTVFLDETNAEDIDFVASGLYTGLGITVSVRDDMLTVIEVQDGFPAFKSGIRVGDRLYKIDSAVIINSLSTELRKYTRKPAGTEVELWVLRDGIEDTLYFKLDIEEIIMKNVTYSGFVGDSIGFIKLVRFTRSSPIEVAEALNNLLRTKKLKGLILDLRDNPGGLLEAAVAICELFVPKNSVIVTTKGRKSSKGRVYKSLLNPVEPDLPLAVLINGSSASASEIVAGAIQDLDRGIIVGEKSYGKGLVQSVFDLPYKTAIKITTSKYYIPSGRCIQKINYGKKKSDIEDTLNFYTKNGRKVDESIGIIPDSIVEESESPYFVQELIFKGIFFNFVNRFTSSLDSLPEDFTIDEKIIQDFNKYIEHEDYYYQTPLISRIDDLVDIADKEKLNKKIKEKLLDIQKLVKSEEKNLITRQKDEVSRVLKFEILRRFETQHDMIMYNIIDDEYINTATGLLSKGLYKVMLSVKDSSLNNGN